MVGAFFHKFSIAPNNMNYWSDLLYHHVKYGGDHGSRASCRRKSVMFFVWFCHSFELQSLW